MRENEGRGETSLHGHGGYRGPEDCVVLMGPLVKTFAPFNDQGCTCNGFMGRDAIHGAEARSPLVKYDAYLLIRSKLYPHYLVRFFVRRVASRSSRLSFLFRRLVSRSAGAEQSTAHLRRDPATIPITVVGDAFAREPALKRRADYSARARRPPYGDFCSNVPR